ncbi:hypothetical protein LRS06_01840 [Hymenobacter sp. J193]|uniref:hypothetical protein n=1 Tax=Hymenobacter sp. J193 TaxID=2898429 RepID=UPI0021513059|nr:hypothetical protein [Hymenobacter sp. J193]MCR5886533.1 hypothetical protein [Hymenobacter sp. J193]
MLYALIDTTGAFIIAPQSAELDGPDNRGFVRRKILRPAGRQVYEYLGLDGKPAFPGRYFGWGEQFTGDSAAVPDTLNRPGVLYANGTWLPRPTTPEKQYVKPARGMVVPADSSRVVFVSPTGHRVTTASYAKGQALAGGWFLAYDNASSPAVLITPAGNRYPLPPGYAPDLLYHGLDNYNHVPFDNGLLKVRWGKPHQEGWEPKREAYMTRSGHILVGDPDPK